MVVYLNPSCSRRLADGERSPLPPRISTVCELRVSIRSAEPLDRYQIDMRVDSGVPEE